MTRMSNLGLATYDFPRLKSRGVVPARESVDEGPSGNDLPRPARTAMRCRRGGELLASHLVRMVQIPHRWSLALESTARSSSWRCSPRYSKQVSCQEHSHASAGRPTLRHDGPCSSASWSNYVK